MSFTNEEIKKVASLARIEMGEDELSNLKPQLDAIIEWVDLLKEVDTDGVEPMLNNCDYALPLRADVVKQTNSRDDILKNAPEKGGNGEYFSVPKMVE